ncbi:MAG: Rid family hydrolase [Deinococcota bacterium]
MTLKHHNPNAVYPPYTNYSHAIEVPPGARLLVISGLNGYLQDGTTMPETFEGQGELIWQYIGHILKSADMDYSHIISIRTYLASPGFDGPNVALRQKFLGDHQPASTVVCCQLLEPSWKLEVEAMAAR